ncbi:MAG: hypothetical protein MUO75_04965 [Actinobacteria bacterium]|nr:hypothetical protein [Actinomycetota bacterium]
MIHRHPNGGWILHMRNLSDGKPCPYCPMTPAEYRSAIKAQETADDERQARVIARGMALARQEGKRDCPLCGITVDYADQDVHIQGCFEISSKGEQVRLNTLLKRAYEAVMCIEFPQEETNKFYQLARDLMKEIDAVVSITGARNIYGPLLCLRCYQDFHTGGLLGTITILEGIVTDFTLSDVGKKCEHDRVKFWRGFFMGSDGKTKEVGWTAPQPEA